MCSTSAVTVRITNIVHGKCAYINVCPYRVQSCFTTTLIAASFGLFKNVKKDCKKALHVSFKF